jgi:RND family efflux transporter MFP subunit
MKRSVKIIAGLAAVLAAMVFWRISGSPPAASDDDQPSVLVSTIQLTQGNFPATVLAYGSIGAAVGAERTITAQAGGIIAAIPVVKGQAVAAGDRLADIAADPQSVATLAAAQNALRAARANRAHVAALLASHLATAADLANADQSLNDAAGALAALQATGTGTNRIITAPFAGVISEILVAPGTLQPNGAALLRIIDTHTLVADVGVPPAQAGAVEPGDSAAVTLLTAGTVISGQVKEAAAMLDMQTGLTDVTLSLEGPAPLGAPVQATITTGTLSGYAVPRDAVQNDAQGDYAFQIDAKNIAHRVAVHILSTSGGQIVLQPDLDPEKKFVTTGAYQLDDGVAVRMANAGGAGN